MTWSIRYRVFSYTRSSLWIMPVIAIVLEQVFIRLIDRLDGHAGWSFYDVSASGARSVLELTITMALSFIVFTFGSLLVAIQVAGGQLTPRIIASTLLGNNVVRLSVGLFVFTLLLATGGLIRTEAQAPQLLVAVATFFAFSCIVCFLFLIDYAARFLRPVSIMRHVGEIGLKVIESVYTRGRDAKPPVAARGDELRDRSVRVINHKGTSGIVLAVNLRLLLRYATDAGCVIEVVPHVGDFVAVDEPLFNVYGGKPLDESRARAAVALGSERTMEQDPMFSFRILVDIAIRALSKAINDPTTTVLAIDQLHRLLRMVGKRHTTDEAIRDDAGNLRVIWHTPNWVDFVHLAISEIRLCGADSVQVARRLRAMIENLILTLPEARHETLRLELDLLDRSIDRLYALPEDAAMARVADSQGLGASGIGAPIQERS